MGRNLKKGDRVSVKKTKSVDGSTSTEFNFEDILKDGLMPVLAFLGFVVSLACHLMFESQVAGNLAYIFAGFFAGSVSKKAIEQKKG